MKYGLLKCDDVFEILTRAPFPAEETSADVSSVFDNAVFDNAMNDNAINLGVEQHLAGCYACRALAEALRPATGLFHESMAEEQRSSLPSYHGPKHSLPAAGVAKSVRAAMGDCAVAEPSCRHGSARQKHHGSALQTQRVPANSQRAKAAFSSGLALAALLVFGTAIYTNTNDGGNPALFSQTHSAPPAPMSASNTFSASNAVAPTLGSAEQYLAALGLPAACRAPRNELKNVLASASTFALGGGWRCCTECHAAGKQTSVAGHTAPVNAVAVVRSESCRVCHTP